MGSKTDFLENELLDHALAVASYTAPATVYIALFTADPTETGSLASEVAVGSYAREIIAFDVAAAGVTQNTSLITFTTATAPWGTISHIGIMDALTAGNMLYHGAFDVAKAIGTLDILTMPIASVSITED